jgi:putative methionine-R-sulfoxide reductase with GAF domain
MLQTGSGPAKGGYARGVPVSAWYSPYDLAFEDAGLSEPSNEIGYLRECLAQRERELEAVSRITTALQARTSLDELVRQTLITAVDTLHAAAGSVLLHDPHTDELVFRYVIGEKADVLTGSRMPGGQGVAGRVFQSGESRVTLNVPADPAHFRRFDDESGFRTESMVTVPLKTSIGHPIGVMQIINKQRGVFNEMDRAVLEILSAQAAGALETARLHEEAKLSFVARTVGNISHDVANMLQDSIGGAASLQNMLAAMFARLDALRATPPEGDPWEAVEAAVRGVRELYVEFCQMMIDGAASYHLRSSGRLTRSKSSSGCCAR